jgi:Flp pilus assembly protein TadB
MPLHLTADAPTRNPVARSLALAVLGLALIVAVVMGAVVFAVLLAGFVVGYAVSLAHAWWRLARLRRRAAFVDDPRPEVASVDVIEAELEIVEVAGEAAPRSSSGPA